MPGDIMTADEARRRMGWDLADAVGRLAKAEARADAAEAERDALRAQLVALANEARPLVEATEGHTPGPWRWLGNTAQHRVQLEAQHSGRLLVMSLARWGMQQAMPWFRVGGIMERVPGFVCPKYNGDFFGIDHPDARAIERAPEALDIAARLVALAGGGEDG